MSTHHEHRPHTKPAHAEHHAEPAHRAEPAHQRGHGHHAGGRHGHHDDHAQGPATAGVETDTRWGDAEESFDISGSILRVSVHAGGTHLTIGRGRADGVHLGMEGYVRNGSGLAGDSVLGEMQVIQVDKRSCVVVADVRPDDLAHAVAVINPSQPVRRPPAAVDHHASILRVTVGADGRARIVVSAGRGEGLSAGMGGYVLGDGGKPGARFELEQVDARSSVATVAMTPDALQRHPHVVLNPSR